MNTPKPKRKRGVILTCKGLQKLLAAKAEAQCSEKHSKHYTLEALSDRTNLDPDTLRKVFACELCVDKRTLSYCFRAFNLRLEPDDYFRPASGLDEVNKQGEWGMVEERISHRQFPIRNLKLANKPRYVRIFLHPERSKPQISTDWGDAPNISVFYGRTKPLATLKHWILEEQCQVVVLLGMQGIGKTSLSLKLAEQIQNDFEFVIWRSLRHAPPVEDILAQLIRFLSQQAQPDLAETLSDRISQLIKYLRRSRCLLLLDHAETILLYNDLQQTSYNLFPKSYHPIYQGYNEFLKQLGETRHQSCLVLTSREKPKIIRWLEGETSPVRVLQIKGLQVSEAKEMLAAKASLSGSTNQQTRLIELYAGNPLLLKVISRNIKQLFDGSIAKFLKQKVTVFGEIHHILEKQLYSLSDIEKEVINRLGIHAKPVSFSKLREQALPLLSPQQLLEALESLEERCLIEKATPTQIEKKTTLFSLLPIIGEYIKDHPLIVSPTQKPVETQILQQSCKLGFLQ